MLKGIILQILPQFLFLIVTFIMAVLTAIAKKWWKANQSLIEVQKQQLIQKIGIDKYNQQVALAKTLIHSVEEQARDLDWDSAIKHAKATELISEATGFSNDEIFNIIKATVDEWNANKLKDAGIQTLNVDALSIDPVTKYYAPDGSGLVPMPITPATQ